MDRAHPGCMACTWLKGKADSRLYHKTASKGTAGAKRGKGKEERREKREEKREEKEKRKGFHVGSRL